MSLDPELRFGSNVDARYDFAMSLSAEDEQRQVLGNIASPGDFIQFLMPSELAPAIPYQKGLDNLRKAENVVGCIPSSIDDVPVPNGSKLSADFEAVKSQFGALTEHGLYVEKKVAATAAMKSAVYLEDRSLRVKTVGDDIVPDYFITKIDLPYTKISQRSTSPKHVPQTKQTKKADNGWKSLENVMRPFV